MVEYEHGCKVILVREGRVITRYQLDLPAGMLVEQIRNGKWRFRRFGQGGSLTAVQAGEQVYVHDGEIHENPEEGTWEASAPKGDSTPLPETVLSIRQRQVLDGLVRGQTLAEIGFHLGIRARSVRHHVDALKTKLRAVSLSQLVARAMAENRLECTPPQGGTGAGRRSDHPKKH
jgi:DNA-binding CsgD family transcriptional regulator